MECMKWTERILLYSIKTSVNSRVSDSWWILCILCRKWCGGSFFAQNGTLYPAWPMSFTASKDAIRSLQTAWPTALAQQLAAGSRPWNSGKMLLSTLMIFMSSNVNLGCCPTPWFADHWGGNTIVVSGQFKSSLYSWFMYLRLTWHRFHVQLPNLDQTTASRHQLQKDAMGYSSCIKSLSQGGDAATAFPAIGQINAPPVPAVNWKSGEWWFLADSNWSPRVWMVWW